MADPTWEEFETEEEVITEDDVKEIEEGSFRAPVGVYLCECFQSVPKQIDFKAYSTLGTKLGFAIAQVLEVQDRPPKKEEVEYLTGKYIFDEVAFSNPLEKDAMRKRRKTVALKMGIVKPGQPLTKKSWQEDALWKKVILRVVANSYVNKSGDTVKNTKVDFFNGYESADKIGTVTEQAEGWDDI